MAGYLWVYFATLNCQYGNVRKRGVRREMSTGQRTMAKLHDRKGYRSFGVALPCDTNMWHTYVHITQWPKKGDKYDYPGYTVL